jgi:hypothetical protein
MIVFLLLMVTDVLVFHPPTPAAHFHPPTPVCQDRLFVPWDASFSTGDARSLGISQAAFLTFPFS